MIEFMTRLVGVCLAAICGFTVEAVAGGSSAGGGAQIAPMEGGSIGTYKTTTASIPGGNAQESAAASGGQAGGYSGSSSAGSAGGTSSSNANSPFSGNGSTSSQGGFSGSSSNSGTSPGEVSRGRTREKVIDTGEKAVQENKAAKGQSTDKRFAPGLLDNVSDISALGAQKGQSSASNQGQMQSTAKSGAAENKDSSKKKD